MMSKVQWIPIVLLRLIAMAASITATVVMLTGHDSASVLNMTFKAKFSNSPTLEYFVVVMAIASVYSLLIVFVPFKTFLWRLILLSDVAITRAFASILVITSFIISSFSAALEVAQIGKKGNPHAGWLPICGQVPKFCDQVTASMIAGFIATILYFLLLIYSLHNALNFFTFKA